MSLICFLNIFDAPEYARCSHIGVCEFLEVCGDTTDTRKLENLLEVMNKCLHRLSSAKGRFGRLAGFFPWLKKIGDLAKRYNKPLIYHTDGILYDVMDEAWLKG